MDDPQICPPNFHKFTPQKKSIEKGFANPNPKPHPLSPDGLGDKGLGVIDKRKPFCDKKYNKSVNEVRVRGAPKFLQQRGEDP